MQAANITGNYPKLEQYYIQKVINISNEAGFSYIVWQEVIDNGVEVGFSGDVTVACGASDTMWALLRAPSACLCLLGEVFFGGF